MKLIRNVMKLIGVLRDWPGSDTHLYNKSILNPTGKSPGPGPDRCRFKAGISVNFNPEQSINEAIAFGIRQASQSSN